MRLFCSKCQKVFEAEKPKDSSRIKCPTCGMEQDYPETVPGPGVVVGDFLIEKLISRGGMGEVFLAKQISLDRPVALKVLQQKHIDDKEYVESLFKEARAAAKLSHPNIVQAYAVGEENGIFYFAMEYIRGETFKQILKREKTIEFTRAATVIRDIARAIGAAWREQKLVHQDIKPDNIMLDANGFAKLSDLGLAKVATGVPDENDDDKVLGTPQYISPEQLTGVPTDIRSDIYSLGATFYHFVTGRFPYVAKTGDEIARMHIECALQPPKEVNKALPDELNRIIVKMMEKDIQKRYQSADELIADLDAYLRSAPPAAKKSTTPAAAKTTVAKKPAAAAKPAAGGKPAVPKLTIPGKRASKPPLAAGDAPAATASPEPAVPPEEPPPQAEEPAGEAVVEDEPHFSRPVKIALIAAGSTVLTVIILLAVLVICAKSEAVPQGGFKNFACKVAGWFGVSSPGAKSPVKNAPPVAPKKGNNVHKGKQAPTAVPQGKTANDGKKAPAGVPKGKSGGKDRKEVSEVPPEKVESAKTKRYKQIAGLPMSTDEEKEEFILQAAEALADGMPTDADERNAYLALRRKFAPIDERQFFVPFRMKKKAERDKLIERRRQEKIEAQRESERNYRNLEVEVDKAVNYLVDGFYAVVNGDGDAMNQAMEKADDLYIRDGENPKEQDLVANYRDFRRRLPAEVEKIRAFRDEMKDIKERPLCKIPIPGSGNKSCYVAALYPDGSATVMLNDERRNISAETFAKSPNFKPSFSATMKDKNPNALFYYGLMTRKFDPDVKKNVPGGFWKKHLAMFIRAAER